MRRDAVRHAGLDVLARDHHQAALAVRGQGEQDPPRVVRVTSVNDTAYEETIEGELVLRDSPWDPYTELLPMREQLSARLVTPIFKDRQIVLEGALDPIAFWPHADTIGGSRWPGDRGGPRFRR